MFSIMWTNFTRWRLVFCVCVMVSHGLFVCHGLARPCDEPELSRHDFTRLAMGTRARVVIYAESRDTAEPAAAAAFERIALLEDVMSDYRPTSELSQFLVRAREADGQPIPISRHMADVLSLSLDLARLTDGAFDPTVGPLVALWRESRTTKQLPDPAILEAARARTGWQRIGMTIPYSGDYTVRIPPGMTLDFGGIGKGYAAGHVRDMLREMGFTRTLIAIGGDIAVGDPPPGVPGWKIAIEGVYPRPVAAVDGSVSFIFLANTCIATSGDTGQYVDIGDQRYSHILDPRTGLGLTRRVSATVIHPTPGVADALGTALCVHGGEHGLGTVSAQFPDALVRIIERTAHGLVIHQSNDFPTSTAIAPATSPVPPGFVPLLADSSLTGWQAVAADPPDIARMTSDERTQAQGAADEAARRHWRIEQGVLHFDGGGPSLRTIAEYENFELLIDWKVGKDGDSGVYLRGVPQVQIWDNPAASGGLYNNTKHPSQPLAFADAPVGEWNRFHIIMRGDRVTVRLNDILVVDDVPLENYWSRNEPLPPRGPIELQAHGTPLWFTNILIKPLP